LGVENLVSRGFKSSTARVKRINDMRSVTFFAVLLAAAPLVARAGEYPIEFRCRGLEEYEIRGTHNVDWAWGNIRAKKANITFGFAVGSMVAEAVPAERPAGFRSFKIERIGDVQFRWGFHVREKQMKVTLIGAPMDRRVNLVAQPRDSTELIAFARALATAPCTVTIKR
jgi:hypothetical protein